MPQKFKRSKNMNSELEEKIDQRGVMRLKPELSTYVDDEGKLVLPPEVANRFGLKPRTQVPVDEGRKEYCEKFKNEIRIQNYLFDKKILSVYLYLHIRI